MFRPYTPWGPDSVTMLLGSKSLTQEPWSVTFGTSWCPRCSAFAVRWSSSQSGAAENLFFRDRQKMPESARGGSPTAAHVVVSIIRARSAVQCVCPVLWDGRVESESDPNLRLGCLGSTASTRRASGWAWSQARASRARTARPRPSGARRSHALRRSWWTPRSWDASCASSKVRAELCIRTVVAGHQSAPARISAVEAMMASVSSPARPLAVSQPATPRGNLQCPFNINSKASCPRCFT